ncbi:MAG TPA: hypothetical protein DF383_13245, partial [Deltaproteobacteria bacterium]|nr:hypothetical protein [Deltaproteobacteria bacterium]
MDRAASSDPKVDAAYLEIETGVFEVTSKSLSEDVSIDFAPDGRLVGIEILSASKHLFQNQKKPEILLENIQAHYV